MKIDKKFLIENAKENGWEYPKSAVWGQFTLFGGAIGGLTLGVLIIIFNILFDKVPSFNRGTFLMFFATPFLLGFFGIFVGMIPATLTGYVIARKKLIITNLYDYGYLFAVGTFFTFICLFILLVIFDKIQRIEDFLTIIIPSMLGGLSAIVCGKLFLPKLDDLIYLGAKK